jgi:hypothetical protein
VGIFQANQSTAWEVDIVRSQGSRNIFRVQGPILIVMNASGVDATHSSTASRLMVKNVALVAKDHLVSSLAMAEQGNQVGHGPTGHE